MPSLIKDLAGFFLGGAPEASKARGPQQPTTATQRDDKTDDQQDDKKDAWWWENRDADRDVFKASRHRAHLPRCKKTGRPLKILALHGRGSNNDITSIQLSSLEIPTRCVAVGRPRRRTRMRFRVFDGPHARLGLTTKPSSDECITKYGSITSARLALRMQTKT